MEKCAAVLKGNCIIGNIRLFCLHLSLKHDLWEEGSFHFLGRYCVSGEQHLFLQTLDRAHVPPVLAVHFLFEPPQKRSGFALGFFLNDIPFFLGRTRPKSYIVYGLFGGEEGFAIFSTADLVEVQALCRGERENWVCWEKRGLLTWPFFVGEVGKFQAGFARAW